MNKIGICMIIAVTMSGLLRLPSARALSASSTPNVTVSARGVVQYPASDPSTPINTATYFYGFGSFTGTQISFIATHFALLDVSFGTSLTSLQAIKTANPNIKIIGYKDLIGKSPGSDDWAEVNSHEEWFVHDASGNRILNTAWNWYLMDVASTGWRQHFVSYVNSELSSQPSYDGVFADDAWNTIASWALSSFDKTIPASVISNWHANTIGFLQYAKANLLSGKLLIVNSDEWNTNDYINIVDGQMLEGYEHCSWIPVTTVETDRPSVSVLASKCTTGKIVWAGSGAVITGVNQAQIELMVKYCYASFLMGMSGSKAYLGWDQGDFFSSYQMIMDTDIGQPVASYYSAQNVQMRDFTKGRVLLNPSANSHTVSLGGNYQLLNGTALSSIVLAPWSGEILLSLT